MKPLTLEEAKSNIGKEVVYIGNDMNAKKDFENYKPIIVAVSPIPNYNSVHVYMGENSNHIWSVEAKDIALKQDLKVGDTVKLDPSTKPYTFINLNGDIENKLEQNPSEEVAKVTYIYNSGDIGTDSYGCIHPRHLIKVEEKDMKNVNIGSTDLSLATHIGKHSKVKSYVSEKGENFLWLNNRWIDGNIYGETYEPLNTEDDASNKNCILRKLSVDVDVNVDYKINEGKSAKVEHKPQYTPEEIELRERIAFKFLEQHVDNFFIEKETDRIFKIITGK